MEKVRYDLMLSDPIEKLQGLAGLFHGTKQNTLVDFSGEEAKERGFP